MYNQRLATLDDASAIAPLWGAFLQQRAEANSSMVLKSEFDYESYVEQKLKSPYIYGFVLESEANQQIVGFLFIYIHDETPTLDFPEIVDSPFVPRRMGGVIGMYVKEEHRKPEAIQLLVKSALELAEELKISDIDLLISIEQKGVQKLLERFGFNKSAIQYTKHYEITETNLPPLKKAVSENIKVNKPSAGVIPLRDPKTQQNVINPQGEQVFLYPVKNDAGEVLRSSNGFPVYPTPLRDPQTKDWIFDKSGELVVCPVVLDESGKVMEYQGIPKFKSPLYEQIDGNLILKQDEAGNYLFED